MMRGCSISWQSHTSQKALIRFVVCELHSDSRIEIVLFFYTSEILDSSQSRVEQQSEYTSWRIL